MPMYGLPIEEIDESVKRPVVAGVVADLLQLFGLREDVPMIFKGQAPQPAYMNSEVNAKFLDPNNRYSAESYLTINDYEEEENETTLLSTPVNYIDHKAVFSDEKLNIHLVPCYVSKRFTVSMSLTGSEKQIERWRANIKRRTSQGVLNGIHTVKYHFPIPGKYMEFLVDAHERRETVKGYGDDLGTWLREKFIPTMTVLRTAAGTSPIFAIQQTQKPIQGWFDFGTGAPKKEKDDEMSRYSLSFTYTFYMDVPETINLITPLVIHNQLIPYQWIPKPSSMPALDYIKEYGSYSQEAFNHFRFAASANEYTYTTRPGLPIPEFDDWIGDKPNTGYVTLIRILVRLDDTDLHKVMDLSSLGEWKINPACTGFMKDSGRRIFSPYDSVINIMLYEGDQLKDMGKLSMDENLLVRYAEPLDLRKNYHVVVTMLNQPSLLSDIGWQDLLSHGCFVREWVLSLYPEIIYYDTSIDWDKPCVMNGEGDSMTWTELTDIIKQIDPNVTDRAIWPLVAFFTIYTHSITELS